METLNSSKNPSQSEKVNTDLVKEKMENLLIDIFPKSKEEDKNQTKIRRISVINFTSLIKEKIRKAIEPFLDFNIIDKYNLFNFRIILKDFKFDDLINLSKLSNLERIKLDPVMISKTLDHSDIEYSRSL
jgi:hypothetical protein